MESLEMKECSHSYGGRFRSLFQLLNDLDSGLLDLRTVDARKYSREKRLHMAFQLLVAPVRNGVR